MRKNIYNVLDTETFGGASNPDGIYNIGGRIFDSNGNLIASYNYLIAEHYNKINESYFKENLYKYDEVLTDGSITVVATEEDAISAIHNLNEFYRVTYMLAYNTAFDFTKTACRSLIEETEFIDIYLMALQTITHLKKYAKFCRENNLISKSGKSLATTAEAVYAFITQNPLYTEEHTALEDSKIEMEIFLACAKMHKRYTKNMHQYDCKVGKCFPRR